MIKPVTIHIDEDLHRGAKVAAAQAGVKLSDWISAALRAALPAPKSGKGKAA
jgi:predicted HicB family RNase H-like nuclease